MSVMTKGNPSKYGYLRHNQIELSRRWIVEAYAKLLSQMPDDKITVSSICAQAGVGRQTFYRHFKSKNEVVLYRLNKGYEIFRDLVQKLPAEEINLYRMLVLAFEIWKEHQTIMNPIVQSQDTGVWLMDWFAHYWRKMYHEFQPPSEYLEYDVEFYVGGISTIFLHWLKRDMKEAPEVVAKLITTLISGNKINSRPDFNKSSL